jgi:hypothetical protein
MPTSIEWLAPRAVWAPPEARPLDEAVWRAWIIRGRAQDLRSSAARIKAVKWVSIAGLLAAAGFGPQFAPYEVVVRFIVTAGAMNVMAQAFQAKFYAIWALFAALALIYNPVAPAFGFSGGWQSAAVVASAVPFLTSLAWRNSRNTRTEHND